MSRLLSDFAILHKFDKTLHYGLRGLSGERLAVRAASSGNALQAAAATNSCCRVLY